MADYNMDDYIFNFIYVTAMRDATLQKAYDVKGKKWLWDTEHDTVKNQIIPKLKSHINIIIKGSFKSQKEYDSAFCKLSNEICTAINNPVFTFGNAQKLINMTVKYFYINTYGNDRAAIFKYCHCPMDSQMLAKVWDEKKKDNEDFKQFKKRLEIIEKNTKEKFKTGWGNINDEYSKEGEEYSFKENGWYNIFQEAVRYLCKKDKIYPIEFDYINWN